MNKKLFNWMLLLTLLLVGSVSFVSCETDNNHVFQVDSQIPSGSDGKKYSPEVYIYLDKANSRENLDVIGRKGYEAKEWRMEAKNNADEMPFSFRWCGGDFGTDADGELPEPSYVPSRQGLDGLNISGSSRFSLRQLKALDDFVNQKASGKTKVLIDLRSECHGFLNGHHVSWYGYINWSNIGKHRDEILQEEQQLFKDVIGKTVLAGKIGSSNNFVMTDSMWITVTADETKTEKEVMESMGWEYRRVTALDHVFPNDETLDQFLEVYRELPENAWVHFHCQAGRGRTTMYMVFFDMLRNPDVPMKDIFYRHAKLGGISLYYQGDRANEQPWRVSLFTELYYLAPLLYDYVQANKANGYQVSWSEWKKKTFNL